MANADVATPIAAYNQMTAAWELPIALRGGTRAMRAAGERWLPKEAKERSYAYERRLNRSILFGAYGDTVDRLSGKPFCETVKVLGEVPEKLKGIESNTDGEGANLTQFARQLMDDGVHYGKAHIIVDFPATGGVQPNIAETRGEVHPYFVRIPPPALIAWRAEQGFPRRLTQVRVKTCESVDDGEYGEKTQDKVSVYSPTECVVWTRVGDKWVSLEPIPMSLGKIAIVTIYFRKTGFMTAESALEDLAWVNLGHWQSMSDQRTILRFARIPILTMIGRIIGKSTPSNDAKPDDVEIGPGAVIQSIDPAFKIAFVEHGGAAIKAGADDLRDLEAKMELLGMMPFVARTGGETATGKKIDDDNAHSDMQAWVMALEAGLRQAYRFAAEWVKVDLPKDFGIDIFSDFGIGMGATQDETALLDLYRVGGIQLSTLLNEFKRRATLSESVRVQDEVNAADTAGPPRGMFGGGQPRTGAGVSAAGVSAA